MPEIRRLTAAQSRVKSRYGPWAVVTGASDGIGRALAEEIAACGLNLVLVARRTAVLEELAETLRTKTGAEVIVLTADLSRPEAVADLLKPTSDLDVGLFAACAGFGTSGDFTAINPAVELEMIAVNCAALYASTRIYAERFKARGGGALVLMSSIVAFQGVPRAANYAATKAYVQSLAEGIGRELAPHGVAVLASAPGPVESGFAARAGMRMAVATKPASVARGTLGALGRRRLVRPGLLSALVGYALQALPRFARIRIMQQVMRGMTKRSE
ncbi:MAG: SDR family oxidoreductase [Rhodospirillales bacterium]